MSQYSKSSLATEINNKVYENVNEAITATNLNQVLQDLNDSAVNIITNTNLLGLKEFDTTRSYVVGDCAVRNDILYQAIVNISPGTFSIGNWQIVNTAAGITVSNGLQTLGTSVGLGGTLSIPTVITQNGNSINFDTNLMIGLGNQTLNPNNNVGTLMIGRDNRLFSNLQYSLIVGDTIETTNTGKNQIFFGNDLVINTFSNPLDLPNIIGGSGFTFNPTQSRNSFILVNQLSGFTNSTIEGANNFLWGENIDNKNGTQSWDLAATRTVVFGTSNTIKGGSFSFISGTLNSISGYSQLVKGENNTTSTQSSYNTLIGTSNIINNNSAYNILNGRKNTVNGQFNNVVGSTNSVTGSFNNLVGSNLSINGDYNVLFGRLIGINDTGTNSFYKGIGIEVKQPSVDNIVFANNSSFEKLTDCFIFGNNLNITTELSDTNIIVSNNTILPATFSNNTTYLNSLTLLPYDVGLTQTGPILEMRGSTGGTAADGRSVGRLLMPSGAGNNSMTIFTTACKTDSYIFISSNGSNLIHISVTAQNTGNFTITRSVNDPITVTWFIINHI